MAHVSSTGPVIGVQISQVEMRLVLLGRDVEAADGTKASHGSRGH